jgi:hypothetical protein
MRSAITVAAYIEQLGTTLSKLTVKAAPGGDPRALRLPDHRRSCRRQPGKRRAGAQVRGQARQDAGAVGRGSAQAPGFN